MPIGPDVSAFRTRPTREEVREFRKRQPRGGNSLAIGIALVVASLIVGVYAVVDYLRHESLPESWLLAASFALPVGLVLVFRQPAWKALTLERFAAANDLVVGDSLPSGYYSGAPFRDRRSLGASQHLAHRGRTRFDYGHVLFARGIGRSYRVEEWGYLAVPLNRPVGLMVLDNTISKDMTKLQYEGTDLATSNILEFGSDADREFTLYCADAYVDDAILVFTPDLLDTLATAGPWPWVAQVVDTWMFVYTSRDFDLLQPDLHTTVYAIVHKLEAKGLTESR